MNPATPDAHLFVWYRISHAARPHVRAWIADLQRRFGARAPRWYVRAQGDDDTWMEVYPPECEAHEREVAAAARTSGIDALAVGVRHVESFLAVEPPTCA